MEQTEESIKRDQKKFRLLIPMEPTPEHLLKWPFLQGHGGVGTIGKNPIFIHFCDLYTMYRLWEKSLATLEENKENYPDYEEKKKVASGKVEEALRHLNTLEWAKVPVDFDRIYLDDLLPTGRYYAFPKPNTEK